MDDRRMREQVCAAVAQRCRTLQPDPFLAPRVMQLAREKGEEKVKRKLSVGLILCIVLVLCSITALAAALLSAMELVEEQAVPLALGNDQGAVRVESYSAEELQQLLDAAAASGIVPDEDSDVMNALRSGSGYWEEEAIMDICREAFGGLFYEWTIEQKHWYQDMMIAIGFGRSNNYLLPGEDDMTTDEARQKAMAFAQAKWGGELPLDDPACYRREEDLHADGWYFVFYPRDLQHPECRVSFDRSGTLMEAICTPQYWERYDVGALIQGINSIYGYRTGSQVSWDTEAWYVFGQMLPGAQLPAEPVTEYEAYAASVYLQQSPDELPQSQARSLALTATGVTAPLQTASVLLGSGEERVWKFTFLTEDASGSQLRHTCELDSRTGAVRFTGMLDVPVQWGQYVLHEVYERFTDGMMTADDAVQLAMEALWQELGNDAIPFGDPAYYSIRTTYSSGIQTYNIMFNTLTLDYGRCSVRVDSQDGSVRISFANPPEVNGDTLLTRFGDVYGSCLEWPQDIWVRYDAAMDGMGATTMQGKLLQQTVYPPESAAAVSREQALQIAYTDSEPGDWHVSMVLIGAQPNPVWKIRMSTFPMNVLLEIDAVTGQILDREPFVADYQEFDPACKMYTLHRDYAPAALAANGMLHEAAVLLSKTYGDGMLDDPLLPLLDESCYTAAIEGCTVTFTALEDDQPDFIVTFGEDGMPERVDMIGELINPRGVLPRRLL